MDTRLYFDHAASTPLDPRVAQAMQPYLARGSANPGALHREGAAAKRAVEDARARIARVIGAQPDEIVFTSGGTEGNNLAVQGVFRAHPQQAPHVVTSALEHASVLDCCRALESMGARLSLLGVSEDGIISTEALERSLEPSTLLVSVQLANNEIGVIEPVRELMHTIRTHRKTQGMRTPYMHTDASQVPAWMKLNVEELGVDLLTLDAQKLYGPKGIGALYIRRGTRVAPLMYGGNQEHGVRPGTPPVPLIVGFAEALCLVEEERTTYVSSVAGLRDEIIRTVEHTHPDALLNGARGGARLPNNVNFSFLGIDAERLVLELDAKGIACATRSACLHGEIPGSAVVYALAHNEERARTAVRFTMGRHTSRSEVVVLLEKLTAVVRRLRDEHTTQQH